MKQSVCIFVDVDDTFVRSCGRARIPIPRVIAHIRALKAQGATLYCWSSGGARYARDSAAECGLTSCFSAFLPKPDVVIDDQPIDRWPHLLQVHPNACEGRKLADYRRCLAAAGAK